jgi:hypothetical protein
MHLSGRSMNWKDLEHLLGRYHPTASAARMPAYSESIMLMDRSNQRDWSKVNWLRRQVRRRQQVQKIASDQRIDTVPARKTMRL